MKSSADPMAPMPRKSIQRNAGFSLVEMIVAIVLSGIIAVGLTGYIADSVDGLNSSSNLNQLTSSGRVAIDRLSMELHNSLPNSIRTTTATAGGDQCIEFVPVIASSSYINAPFSAAGAASFNTIDFMPDLEGVTVGGINDLFAVIYPHRQNQLYDAENATTSGFPFRGPIEQVTGITNHGSTSEYSIVSLADTHRFRRRSPNDKVFVTGQPVSYCVSGDKLYRYQNYGFYDVQTSTEEEAGVCEVLSSDRCLPNYAAAPDKVLITNNISNATLTAFSISSQSLRRASVVSIVFNMASDGDVVTLNHEVLVRNAP